VKFRVFQFLFKFLLILSFSAYFGALTYSDEKSDEMLEEAVQAGDLVQVQAALAQDANPDHAFIENRVNRVSCLYYACRNGDWSIVKALLKKSANPNPVDYGRPPHPLVALIERSEKDGNPAEALEALELLLAAGAELTKPIGNIGFSSLEYATTPPMIRRIVNQMVVQKVDPKPYLLRAMQNAAGTRMVEKLKHLLSRYPDAPIENQNRQTLLWNAISFFPDTQEEESAALQTVQLLLETGIDVNRRDFKGNSVMHYLVQMLSGVLSHPAKVTRLFRWMAFLKGEGGDLELKNDRDESPRALLVTLREKIRLRVPRQLESFNQWIENLEKGSLQKLQ
jgi:ankyrin repeat protein